MKSSCLAVVLVVVVGCGKSEKKGDCGKAIDNAMSLSKEDYKRSNVAEATLPKIREQTLARCTEDKWANAVLVCLENAKSTDDVIKCQKQMTQEQQDSMAKAITAVISAEKPATPEPGTGTGDGTGAGTGAAEPTTPAPAGMPAECSEYRAVIEKLAGCDKLPQASRDMLQKTFETTSKTWENFDKLPESSRSALIAGCRQGVEAVKQAAGATCGL